MAFMPVVVRSKCCNQDLGFTPLIREYAASHALRGNAVSNLITGRAASSHSFPRRAWELVNYECF